MNKCNFALIFFSIELFSMNIVEFSEFIVKNFLCSV